MSIKLNHNSPIPSLTNQLIDLGLSFEAEYTIQWSKNFDGEWDIKESKSKKVILTLKVWKVDELLKNKLLVSDSFFSKRDN